MGHGAWEGFGTAGKELRALSFVSGSKAVGCRL